MKSIQLPDDIYQRASELAAVDNVSVDRMVAALVSEGVGDWLNLRTRAERGSLDNLRLVLSKVSDRAPEPADRL